MFSLNRTNTSNKKLIFYVFSAMLLTSITALLVWVNFSRTPQDNITKTDIKNQNVDFKDKTVKVQVTEKTFEDSVDLELIDETPIGFREQILFLPGDQIGYMNQNLQFRISNINLENSPSFFPNKMFYTDSGIVINEHYRSTIYQNNGEFLTLASNISNITPFKDKSSESFLYLDTENKEGNLTIKQANSILLSANPPTIASLQTQNQYQFVELAIFNQTPYILGYENLGKTGDVDIYQVTTSGVKKVKVLEKVIAIKIQNNQLLYSNELDIPNELTLYKTSIINFDDPANIQEKELQVTTKLAQNGVFGGLLASRCDINMNGKKVLCLAKNEKELYTNANARDVVFEIDVATSNISFPYPNLVFSADSIHRSEKNEVYIISQNTSQLYKIK
jgi:hypothetical protein